MLSNHIWDLVINNLRNLIKHYYSSTWLNKDWMCAQCVMCFVAHIIWNHTFSLIWVWPPKVSLLFHEYQRIDVLTKVTLEDQHQASFDRAIFHLDCTDLTKEATKESFSSASELRLNQINTYITDITEGLYNQSSQYQFHEFRDLTLISPQCVLIVNTHLK